MADGALTLFKVTVQNECFDPRAIQQLHGMETMLGGGAAGAVLGSVMLGDPQLSVPIGEPLSVLVCQNCVMLGKADVGLLWESANEAAHDAKATGVEP